MIKFRNILKCIATTSAVFVFSAGFSQGPQLVKLTPPSPSVMAMQKYGDIPVSAYTGVADISIPIYTIKFRDITVPISISYHASGIKVAEEATMVGLGWTLNAAGTISRNIIGEDDWVSSVYFNGPGNTVMDFSNGQGPTTNVQTGCNLQMFNSSVPNSPTIYNYDIMSAVIASPTVDFHPDQYYYNYPGHSGKFLLKRNKEVVLQKQEAIAAIPATDGSTWQLKSAEGYIYDFELSEYYSEIGIHRTAWYLTKITSPSGNVVIYNYTNAINYVQSVGAFTENFDAWDIDAGMEGRGVANTGNQTGVVPGKQYYSKVLSSIDFTNGRVVFHSSNARTDLPNDPRLDSISIYNQGAVIPLKTFAFAYDYFNGSADPRYAATSGNANLRLKLTQITEKGYHNGGNIQNPPYIFVYNEMNGSLPAKTSFARDHWGYYNGVVGKSTLIPSKIPFNNYNQFISSLGLIGPEREANPFWTPAFSLTTLKYPTGGWTEFEYESNDFDETLSQINDNSFFNQPINNNTPILKSSALLWNASIGQYSNGINTIDLSNEYVDQGISPQVTINAVFRFTGGTGGNCNDISGSANQVYFVLKNSSGGIVSQVDPFTLPLCPNAGGCVTCVSGTPVFTYTNSYSLSPGVYTWEAYKGTNGAALKLVDIRATYSWYEMASNGNPGQTNTITAGGGLRIKRIINHDNINEKNNTVRRYDYHYKADKTSSGVLAEYSYGRRMNKPQYSYFTFSIEHFSILTPSGCQSIRYMGTHLMRSSDSNNPMNGSAGGAPVGYDQVTEFFGENGEFGKKVYKYYNIPDVVPGFNDPFSGQSLPLRPPVSSTTPDPLNGSLLNVTDYVKLKGQYYKVKEATNAYATITGNKNVIYGAEYRTLAYNLHGDACVSIPPTTCGGETLSLTYKNMTSDWSTLTNSTERVYNQQGDESKFTETVTNYYYDNPAHYLPTRTVTSSNSKGEIITATTRYPLDFTIAPGANDAFTQGIQNLNSKHVVSAPVEKYIKKQKADLSNIGTTSYVLTSYKNTAPAPALAYVSMLSAPNTSFTPSSISASGLVKDGAYQPLINFDSYDANGNLTQQHKEADVNMSYVYDYNNSLVIAEVSNAAANEIAYTSFEADGNGNWTNTDATRNTSFKLTGKQCYTLTTGKTISRTVPSGKQYIVSYWSRNGAVTVNGVAATSGLTKNGWTYYQHLLSNTTTTVNVTAANATIDELRLFPSNAKMSSYTYWPLIGITTVCSPNNMIQYSEYDALGRLDRVLDIDGNIIKTAEYRYQNQVGN